MAKEIKNQTEKVKKTVKKEATVKKTAKKASVVKEAVKAEKPTTKAPSKPVAKKTEKVAATVAVGKVHGLTVDVLGVDGTKKGSITLPEALFGVKINPALIAQAVRVYLVNQRQGTVSTKTRGEVAYSTRKIYRQKGTGRARHGGRGAPVFVKGGVAHGPKPKTYELSLPKKMKKAALFSALSQKAQAGEIMVVQGLEELEAKTKVFAQAFKGWAINEKNRNTLLVLPEKKETIQRGARNLAGVTIVTAPTINTYEILRHKTVIVVKEAISTLEKVFGGKADK